MNECHSWMSKKASSIRNECGGVSDDMNESSVRKGPFYCYSHLRIFTRESLFVRGIRNGVDVREPPPDDDLTLLSAKGRRRWKKAKTSKYITSQPNPIHSFIPLLCFAYSFQEASCDRQYERGRIEDCGTASTLTRVIINSLPWYDWWTCWLLCSFVELALLTWYASHLRVDMSRFIADADSRKTVFLQNAKRRRSTFEPLRSTLRRPSLLPQIAGRKIPWKNRTRRRRRRRRTLLCVSKNCFLSLFLSLSRFSWDMCVCACVRVCLISSV